MPVRKCAPGCGCRGCEARRENAVKARAAAQTPKARAKRAESNRGLKRSAETRAKIAEANRRRKVSEETRAKLARLATERMATPDAKAAVAASNRRRHKGDNVTYVGAHCRVRALRGRAADYPCARCGVVGHERAQWAYNGADPNERYGTASRTMPYSPNPAFYIPLCEGCHIIYDVARGGRLAHSL